MGDIRWSPSALLPRAALLLGLLAVLMLAGFAVQLLETGEADESATRINESGRQRLLTRDLAHTATLLVHAEDPALADALTARMLDLARELSHRDAALGNGSAPGGGLPAGVVALLDEPPVALSGRRAVYIDAAFALAAAPRAERSADHPAYRTILDEAVPIVQGYDLVVAAWQADTAARTGQLHLVQFTLFGLGLATLVVFPFAVLMPIAAASEAAHETALQEKRRIARVLDQRARAAEQRTRELERSNADLEQFAYVASHDLQEPLRMVSSYVQLLERRYGEALDDRAQEYIRFAVEGSVRMQGLIQDLLAYSRVGREPVPDEPVELDRVLEHVLTDLELAVAEEGAQVHADPLPTVAGDETQVRQLLQNLLSNAFKFRGDEPPQVTIRAVREGPSWHVSVQDNGIGIDKPFQDRVFQIFKRLHTRTDYPGNGVGLAVCKRIVDHHGGRIWLESEVGRGSTFHFTLPAYEPPRDEAPLPAEPRPLASFSDRSAQLV